MKEYVAANVSNLHIDEETRFEQCNVRRCTFNTTGQFDHCNIIECNKLENYICIKSNIIDD